MRRSFLALALLLLVPACSTPDPGSDGGSRSDGATEVDGGELDASLLDADLADGGPDAPSPSDAPVSCDADEAVIAALTEGLFYTSEGDEPLMVRSFPGEGGAAPTAEDVLRLSVASAGSTTDVRTVDAFFANVVVDPTAVPPIDPARPDMLRAAVERAWRDLSFVRVIDPAEPVRVRVFLVGRTQCGSLAWLRSLSIET